MNIKKFGRTRPLLDYDTFVGMSPYVPRKYSVCAAGILVNQCGFTQESQIGTSRMSLRLDPKASPTTKLLCFCLSVFPSSLLRESLGLKFPKSLKKSPQTFRPRASKNVAKDLVAFQVQTQNRSVLATQFAKSHPCSRW